MIETKTQNLDPSKTKLSGAHSCPQFKTKIPVGPTSCWDFQCGETGRSCRVGGIPVNTDVQLVRQYRPPRPKLNKLLQFGG